MNLISLDKNLFLAINGLVGKAPLFDSLIKLVVNEYFVPVSLSLILLYLWFQPVRNQEKNQQAAPIAFFATIATNLTIDFSNQFITRLRPFAQLPTHLLFYRPTDPSFPSNAAAVGFVLATAIFIVNRRVGTFALLLAAFYALSRVYAGVHFPSDVLAGAALGVLVSLLVSRYTKLIKGSTALARRVQKRWGLELD